MGVKKSLWISSDRRAGREHFQALGHRRRWGRRNTSRWAPWNVCQTRYREFPKFENHLELDTALFFLSEVWKAHRVGDTALFFLELVRGLYGRNPSSSNSSESSHCHWCERFAVRPGQQTASKMERCEASTGPSSERKHPASCFGFAMLTHFPHICWWQYFAPSPLPLIWTTTNQIKLFG